MVPELEKCGLWINIIAATNLVTYHANSLIHNDNSNCVEDYNSIVAKYVGGKRINFSFRGNLKFKIWFICDMLKLFKICLGSYNTRCHTSICM